MFKIVISSYPVHKTTQACGFVYMLASNNYF